MFDKSDTEVDSSRSSKSALHGLIHWLATIYARKGITVNGVAPALIEDTKMLNAAVLGQLRDRKYSGVAYCQY